MTRTLVGTPDPDDENNSQQVNFSITSSNGYWTIAADGVTISTIPITAMNITSGTIGASIPLSAISGSNIKANAISAEKIQAPLFVSWLAQTKELQEQWYGKKFEDFTHQELVDWIRINVLAADDELHEALGEVSWKPWAKSEFFHRDAFLGEIVDVLHFVGNLIVGAGFTDADLNEAYLEKMERNRERQRQGYTGTDKCTKCGRAVDDIEAHGGAMVQGYFARIAGTMDVQHRQWCDKCSANGWTEIPYNSETPCDICGKRPREQPGFIYQYYSEESLTVHTEGYGCSKCHCDSGDDHK